MKVRKVFGTETTDYLDGFQYTDSVLKFFPTAEGYFNVETGKYVYNYTDHLGNVRISYAKNRAGTEIIEESNYYPFGLKHEGYNILTANPAYKYNGKGLQESGMYDYGARMYMPDLGRWGVVDPLAEVNRAWSPYRYAYNNPLRFIDPDGWLEDWYEDDETGDIAWHDGSATRVGQTNITQKKGAQIPIAEKEGDNITVINILNSDGSITRNGETITNGYSTTTVAGRTITSRNPWEAIVNASAGSGGMGGEFRFSSIIGYGWSGALGHVAANGNNGSSFYANINFGAGFDVGPSFSLYSINPPVDHDFKVGDFEGRGMGYSGTAFFLNGSYGGTDENQKFGVKCLITSNFSSGSTGYTTMGMGVNPFGFGGSYQYGATKKIVIKLIEKNMKKNIQIIFLISLIGFIFLFVYFNSDKKNMSDFFKSDKELFLNDFSPIIMNKYKYLGEVADTTNHMYPYLNFGKICLPFLEQWKNKIKIGDYVSKKKDSLTLFIESKENNYYLHLDTTSIGSAPSPCSCEKLRR